MMPRSVDADPDSLMKVDQLTDEEVKKLRSELHSSDRELRSTAFERLHQLLKDRAIFGLVPSELSGSLQYEDAETRRQGSWAIGKMAQNKIPGDYSLDLMERLTKDPDAEVRENAAWAIGEIAGVQMGREGSITFLNDLLDDESFDTVQMEGVHLIGYLPVLRAARSRSFLPATPGPHCSTSLRRAWTPPGSSAR